MALESFSYEQVITRNLEQNIEAAKREAKIEQLKLDAIEKMFEVAIMNAQSSAIEMVKQHYESIYGSPEKHMQLMEKFSDEINEFFSWLGPKLNVLSYEASCYRKMKYEEEEKNEFENLEKLDKLNEKFMEIKEIREIDEKQRKLDEYEKILQDEKEALRKLEEQEWKTMKTSIILIAMLKHEEEQEELKSQKEKEEAMKIEQEMQEKQNRAFKKLHFKLDVDSVLTKKVEPKSSIRSKKRSLENSSETEPNGKSAKRVRFDMNVSYRSISPVGTKSVNECRKKRAEFKELLKDIQNEFQTQEEVEEISDSSIVQDPGPSSVQDNSESEPGQTIDQSSSSFLDLNLTSEIFQSTNSNPNGTFNFFDATEGDKFDFFD